MKLPVVDEPPCFGCAAPCCHSYVVPLTGFDLYRMMSIFKLPWQAVAEVRSDRDTFWDFFFLDEQKTRHAFFLKRRERDRGCSLLLELPGGHQRCGAHEARPFACRIYPFKVTGSSQLGLDFIGHAMCPPPERAAFAARIDEAKPMVTDELYERELYLLAVARWNDLAATVPRATPLAPGDYAAWLERLYEAMRPLRRGPFLDWHAEAQRLVRAFPLPETYVGAV